MIHFDKQLCEEAEQIIKVKDKFDLTKDLNDIKVHLNLLEIYPSTKTVILSVHNLDKRLHNKYPIIDVLLSAGSQMANLLHISSQQSLTVNDSLKSNLTQDYFGILCHALIKEEIIKTVEQFIDHVD